MLPAPHSGREPSAITPVVTGGQPSEAGAGAEPGDEGGWGRRQVRGVGVGRVWGHQAVRGALRGHCSSFWTWEKAGSDLAGAGWGLLHDARDAPVGEEGMMRGRGSSGHWEWLRERKSQAPKASPSPGSWPLGTCTHGAGTASLSGAGTSPEEVAS